jgi:YHS domain-containing protein
MDSNKNTFSRTLFILLISSLGSCASTKIYPGPQPVYAPEITHTKGDAPVIDYSGDIIATNLPHTNTEQQTSSTLAPAIQGYSPVSYFTKNVAEKGSQQFMVEYKGKTYYLTSARQVELFKQNPEKYIPLFGRNCPYNLILGRQVAIDPTNYKIAGDVLLLFHHSEEMDGLKLWNKKSNNQYLREREMIEHAKNNLLRLNF